MNSNQDAGKDRLGLIQIYTGDGTGKTTAALGLALRAAGHDMRVIMIQFMKPPREYGECKTTDDLKNFTLVSMGKPGLVDPTKPREEDYQAAEDAMEAARRAIHSGEYDIVILDEINVAVTWGLVTKESVLKLLRERPEGVEIILTGRYAPPEFLEVADLVTEMKCVRHPFEKGVPARTGIER